MYSLKIVIAFPKLKNIIVPELPVILWVIKQHIAIDR